MPEVRVAFTPYVLFIGDASFVFRNISQVAVAPSQNRYYEVVNPPQETIKFVKWLRRGGAAAAATAVLGIVITYMLAYVPPPTSVPEASGQLSSTGKGIIASLVLVVVTYLIGILPLGALFMKPGVRYLAGYALSINCSGNLWTALESSDVEQLYTLKYAIDQALVDPPRDEAIVVLHNTVYGDQINQQGNGNIGKSIRWDS